MFISEIYESFQGEGPWAGTDSLFIRTSGCNLRCWFCDTPYTSWNPQGEQQSLDELQTAVEKSAIEHVVITGGEPLHHNLDDLALALREASHIPLHLETSGVDGLTGNPDWITLSPKPHRPPSQELLNQCDELKVIVETADDLVFANSMAKAVRQQTVLLLQPGWDSPEGQQLAIDHVKRQPHWRLSLQTHKWLGVR